MLTGTAVSGYFAVKADEKASELTASLGEERRLVTEKNLLLDEKEGLIADLGSSNESARAARDAALARRTEMQTVLKFFREKVLAANRPEGQVGGLGIDATIRDAVDAAEPLITASFKNQPLVEASIRETLANTYFYLGQYDKSI
jgi:hypothetical protein